MFRKPRFVYAEMQEGESWRVYTNRLAKLNHTNRRRILKWFRRYGRTGRE